MKEMNKILLTGVASLLLAGTAHAASSSWTGSVDDDYHNAGNWSAGVPGSSGAADVATLGGEGGPASVINVNSLFATGSATYTSPFIDVFMRNNTTLNLNHSFRIARNFHIGSSLAAGNGTLSNTVNVNAGQLFVRDDLVIGDDNTHTKTDTLHLSGAGQLLLQGAAGSESVVVNDTGVFHLNGENVTATIGDGTNGVDAQFIMNDTATLKYTLGAAAASLLDIEAGFTIGANSLLEINAASYTGGVGTVTLASFGSKTGTFDVGNISIDGLAGGLSGSITYTGTTMDLTIIPEPGTYALLAGMTGLVFVMLRRRK